MCTPVSIVPKCLKRIKMRVIFVLVICMMKVMIIFQWFWSLLIQCLICLSPKSQLSCWPLEYYLFNYLNYCQIKNEALFFFYQLLFFPSLTRQYKWITWFQPLFFMLLRTCSFNLLGISLCCTFSFLKPWWPFSLKVLEVFWDQSLQRLRYDQHHLAFCWTWVGWM